MKVRNENRFELREPLRSFLTSIKNIFGADACVLYLISKEMDELEKRKEFRRRFPQGIKIQNDVTLEESQIDNYNILKFIGVDDSYEDENQTCYNYWNFNYKKRPNKYIVIQEDSESNYIKGEGITGKTARLKKIFYLRDNEIHDDPARHDDNDTERGIHPKCQKLLSLPILENNKSIGVLRLDIYEIYSRNQNREFKNNIDNKDLKDLNTNSEIYLMINELCKQVIDISNTNSNRWSYSKLFNGEKILDTIKDIKKYVDRSNSTKNKDLYLLIEHLFFVFQRHTYIGYDEIMKRVMYFIKDLFDILDMRDYYDLIEKKLKEFRDHEQLMLYDIEKYRDHFMHQFHVFILGYIILNFIGFKKITHNINRRLKNTSDFNKITIDHENILRIWALISFFHDITYIFEEYENKMQNFILKQLNTNVPININWGNMLLGKCEKSTYMDWLQKIVMFFESPVKKSTTNKECLFRNYIQSLQHNQDHGVLSSLLLVELFIPKINDDIDKRTCDDNDKLNKKIVEIYLAALAISFHNQCVFYSLKEKEDFNKLSFESFPLEFLLMFCDTAQEWGRKKEIDKASYSAPILKSVDLVERPKKTIVCNLYYQTGLYPDDQTLKGFFQEKISKFCSRSTVFKIVYHYKPGKNPYPFIFPSR